MPVSGDEGCPIVFCRPQHKEPTRHLRLSGCGPGLGCDPDAVTTELLAPLHCVSVAPSEPGQAHIYATFPDTEAATAALEHLHGREYNGRVLSVKYAETKRVKQVGTYRVSPVGGDGGLGFSGCQTALPFYQPTKRAPCSAQELPDQQAMVTSRNARSTHMIVPV